MNKEQLKNLNKIEIINHFRPRWNIVEATYFMLNHLDTVNPKKGELIEACFKILKEPI